ncbi:MAG TPA: tetratricopeptide repeat protein, partial [Myxococcota bacterium]|nr:tetratricopeptide repeat protein [Myxococcota bacterium]
GCKGMLDDTDAAYSAAIAAFNEALGTDTEYADAMAGAALAHTLQGSDWIATGQALLKSAQVPADERRALQAAKAAGGKAAKEAAARLAELEQGAATRRQEALDALEKGGKLLGDGQVLLLKARRLGVESPFIAEAQAIWYTLDPEGAARAQEQLTHAVQLKQGTQATLSLTDPPDMWSPLIQGRIWSAPSLGNTARAVEAYRAALKHEPRLQRARWELASLYVQEGQKDEAIKLLDAILAAVPTHEKAERLLSSLNHAQEKVVAAAESPSPKPTEPAGRHVAKGKRHRGKRK